MASYEPVTATPILAIQDGQIVTAATVLAHVTQFGKVSFHVATWEAGRGQRSDYLSPSEFSTWRRSFGRPEQES